VASTLACYSLDGWEIEHTLRHRRAELGKPKADGYYARTVKWAIRDRW
jgi:hypothetical protein